MCRCNVSTVISEADKSAMICRLFSFTANHNEKQKGKIGVWNRQRGLRLWSKTNQYTARVLSCKISFVQLKTYLAESRPTDSVATYRIRSRDCTNYNRLHTEKTAVNGIADCFNYLEHQYWQNPTSCNEEEQDLAKDSSVYQYAISNFLEIAIWLMLNTTDSCLLKTWLQRCC